MATKKTEGQKFKDCESNYDEFKKAFSIDQLDGLTIDNYAGGKGNRESFSHWLLHGLRGLGSINSRQNFGLFQVYYNSAGKIVYPPSYKSPEAAMDKIRQTIKDIAEYASKGEFEKIDEINFPESVKWKIAFVYAPGELNNKQLIPIYSQKELKKIASKVGMKNIGDNTQISEIHKYLIDNKPANEELSQYYERLWKQSSRKENKSEDVINNTGTEPIDSLESKDKDSIMINDLNLIKCLQENSNIILHGAPGTGKTYLAQKIAEELCATFKMVQFHPSYDYTDFVEGLRPTGTDNNGNIIFARQDGVFKKFCKEAIKEENKEKPFIFLIDEINRGDMSKIFGELFYAIDPGYRGEDGKIDTQYQNLVPDGDDFKGGFYVPKNVYIIGTMNDIDRSVESMDFAMRRRFQFIEVTAESRADDMFKDDKGDKLPKADKAKEIMTNLNNCIISKEIGLSKAHQIGGSYFKKFAGNKEDAQSLWDYHLKGLLREYLRGEEENAITDKVDNRLKKAFDLDDNFKYNADGSKQEKKNPNE